MYNVYPSFGIGLTQNRLGYAVYAFLNSKYHFDVLYNKYIIGAALSLGLTTTKVLDKGVIEMIGPFGLSESLYQSSNKVALLDTGIITTYGLYIILGMITLCTLSIGGLLFASS